MVYTEIKAKKKNKYFYRTVSIRKKNKIMKKRVYLGKNLSKKDLKEIEKKADRELSLLSSLLTEKEVKELEEIQKKYINEPKSNLENRYEAFCALFTYNSTAIEGNTLTLQEISSLLFENIVPASKSLREINEATNHREAFDFILDLKEEVSKKIILYLHKIVIKNTLKKELEDQTGKYRKVQVYIRGVEWIPPKPEEVRKEMKSLLSWYSKNKGKLHPLITAAYFHTAFEIVHPFVDGNGRVGRLLMNLILHKNKFPMINIPNRERNIYYKCLEEAQIKENLRPFIEFLIRLIKEEKIRF